MGTDYALEIEGAFKKPWKFSFKGHFIKIT